MRNYPILKWKNFIPYKVYNESYLNELNNLVFSLYQYSEYFVTDYKEKNYEELIYDVIIIEGDKEVEYNGIYAPVLYFHEICQVTSETILFWDYEIKNDKIYPLINQYQKIDSGTVIVNKARAEGTKDKHSFNLFNNDKSKNKILLNQLNYFLQPMGWASFFTYSFLMKEGVSYYSFIFERYGGEKYGNKLYFSMDAYNTRYVNTSHAKWWPEGSQYIISARDMLTKKNLILDKQGHIWSNYQTNPIMSFTFLQQNNQDYGEEIMCDNTWKASIFAKTNIANYTIASRENIADWPRLSDKEDVPIAIQVL